ncbi:hypothetical protein 278BB001_146 [Bacillus phage 278BB001]|nr:hypothetical protein 010DV004_153 [Bacillus phage 010DV004]QZA69370.1 hypothetical protein 010DV005_153 [Bacillus phage 010DV005]QZA69938.1 hypothetical protein 043JT007_152 [Bacillus phage 043JT007]QZA70297.1 hypothetical protein 278BB001_146 [Bacillus phage 278BB001]
MAYNRMDGKLIDPTASDYIKLLQDHIEVYGDTRVRAYFEGELVHPIVQAEHFRNALVLNFEEEEE